MADLTITAGTVLRISGATGTGTLGAGVTGTQGLVVTEAAGLLVQASNTTAALADFTGMLLTAGSAGQTAIYVTDGAVIEFTASAALIVGEIYVVSTAGLISPVGDYTTGDYLAIVGICKAASKLTITKQISGVARA